LAYCSLSSRALVFYSRYWAAQSSAQQPAISSPDSKRETSAFHHSMRFVHLGATAARLLLP